MIKNFCLVTEHQDIEGLQRMHLVSFHADLDCEHVYHQKLHSIYLLRLSHCTICSEQSPAIHTALQKFLMKKPIFKLCAQDPEGVMQAQICLKEFAKWQTKHRYSRNAEEI